MIAPELKPRNGYPDRQPTMPLPPPAYEVPQSNRFSSAISALSAARSAIGGAAGRYPLAVLITAAAVVGVTAGWFVKRR